jgi:hypothetical protein
MGKALSPWENLAHSFEAGKPVKGLEGVTGRNVSCRAIGIVIHFFNLSILSILKEIWVKTGFLLD